MDLSAHHPYSDLCPLRAAGACVVAGGEASLGAFVSAGGPAPLQPAETDHLRAAAQEQPAEHRDGESAAQDRRAQPGQEPTSSSSYCVWASLCFRCYQISCGTLTLSLSSLCATPSVTFTPMIHIQIDVTHVYPFSAHISRTDIADDS